MKKTHGWLLHMMDESDGEFGMYFVFCFSLFSSNKEASEVDKGGTRTSSKFPVNIKQKYSCLKAFFQIFGEIHRKARSSQSHFNEAACCKPAISWKSDSCWGVFQLILQKCSEHLLWNTSRWLLLIKDSRIMLLTSF